MSMNLDKILFPNEKPLPAGVSACDHYAGHEKLIIKSLETQKIFGGTFDITFDLEDGASIGQEAALRSLFANIINSDLNEYNKVGIRIHDAGSPHFIEDLRWVSHEILDTKIAHLTIPKILDLSQAKKILTAAKVQYANAKRTMPPIRFLIETPGAVEDVWKIAALEGVQSLDFGCMDFISFHYGAISDQCFRSPLQFEHPIVARAKTRIVAACLAHAIIPVHNVTIDYQDPNQAYEDAFRARNQFGFLRMWSIHPNQIKPILDAFAPSSHEIEQAKNILGEAEKNSWAPISFDGRLQDRASYRYYWNLLKRGGYSSFKS